jgi:hypothetical protein
MKNEEQTRKKNQTTHTLSFQVVHEPALSSTNKVKIKKK